LNYSQVEQRGCCIFLFHGYTFPCIPADVGDLEGRGANGGE
jgi:hypothetical protein